MATIVELAYYPVKSCAPAVASSVTIVPAGPPHDRAFLVTDPDGEYQTQRGLPRLAVVRPSVSEDGTTLTLNAPDVEPCAVPVDVTGPRRPVTLFGEGFTGIDQGEPVADWLSTVLGGRYRLVRVPPEHDRVTKGAADGVDGTASYADSAPLMLLSRASLRSLNARLTDGGNPALPMGRFRPNLVVDGWDEPFTEDRLRRFRVGDAELAFAKRCIRCVVTTVDQETGRKQGPEPLRTLAAFRRDSSGVAFGVKLSVLRGGKVSVGDELEVDAWGEPLLGRRPGKTMRGEAPGTSTM
ncbi:MOSC domain-containing protein [Cryptosporangium minutisporangium]|uniref:MOSC N-terminal beta barrel domain-containing protein n=1 Tax=Cryptosporangium minutisporangium TaxID=113569 RepID=A0ABP6T6D9_9ACTN